MCCLKRNGSFFSHTIQKNSTQAHERSLRSSRTRLHIITCQQHAAQMLITLPSQPKPDKRDWPLQGNNHLVIMPTVTSQCQGFNCYRRRAELSP